MIVSIHQPHFLPWLGYFNKVLHSQVFIWLHSVQYRKNYFQNRTRIKNRNEEPLWLTLPVHAKLGMAIDAVTVTEPRWRDKVGKTLEQCYGKSPWFGECWPPLAEAMAAAPDQLDEINYRTFLALLRLLDDGAVRVVRAGELPVSVEDPTDRLVALCRAAGARQYLAGRGGHNYLRAEAFTEAGIAVAWQEFDPARVTYPQAGGTFIPGLSMIDCLFNVGPKETRRLALEAWSP